MRLINAVQAASILNVGNWKIRTLIKGGHLKDYAPIIEGHRKHFAKLDLAEVKAFKKNYKILYRGVELKSPVVNGTSTINGHEVSIREADARPSLRDNPINTPPSYLPVKAESLTPVQSFNERLKAIEEKLDTLVKMWS